MGVVYRAVRSKESPGSAPEVGWRTALKYRAEAANRLGNTALALNSAEQLKEIAEGLLKTSPDNFTARADRYRALSLMGEAWEIRSRKTGSGADRRQAESWFQQALDGYSALEKKASLSRTDKAAVTRSGQALARLRADSVLALDELLLPMGSAPDIPFGLRRKWIPAITPKPAAISPMLAGSGVEAEELPIPSLKTSD
jgi:hypothetical protein